MKRQAADREKIKDTSDKELVLQIYTELSILNNKETSNPSKK